ncbi:MAG: 4Fe-4S dicluster domain-containing protein [Deltaproteobacteria bacterium]|nr:4Fe-4S dicluster domain-containing protein [Candidatus Anaeroferrophillus wilburensis]MBN2890065.1 4Fe-4S dicluster domain-containing protein [Deltaproteobacteria bacterium]
MGHHLDAKSNLVPLIDRLNKYPIGLVDSEKLRKILSFLFTEQEAIIASSFPLEETTLPELARLTSLKEEKLQTILASMADKGLVMDLPYGNTTYYLLVPGLIGFFELTFMKNRSDLPMTELARLMADYLHDRPHSGGQADEFFGSRTPLTRSLVYEEHIPVSSQIATYEQARKIITSAGYGAAGMCYCRHAKQHLGETCKKGAPVEGICISLGAGAKFLVRRGFAHEKSTEELLAILDQARQLNLTHVTDNIRHKPSFICNCCQCCCELMAGVQEGFHQGIGKTGFLATIDESQCVGCGLCFAACNVKAIGPAAGQTAGDTPIAQVNRAVCLGCGACISVCPHNAISLVELAERPVPPAKRQELFVRILKEKGRLLPFVVGRMKKKIGSLLPFKR